MANLFRLWFVPCEIKSTKGRYIIIITVINHRALTLQYKECDNTAHSPKGFMSVCFTTGLYNVHVGSYDMKNFNFPSQPMMIHIIICDKI